MTKNIILTTVIILILVLGLAFFMKSRPQKPSKLDGFATCLKDKGAVFYGAFWCPHCKEQKDMFGKSAKLIPYVECSTPDGKAQTAICISKKIEGYPTWEFADGSRMSAVMKPQDLAEKAGCAIE